MQSLSLVCINDTSQAVMTSINLSLGQEHKTLEVEFARLDARDQNVGVHPMSLGDYVKHCLEIQA
jgi:hypothetical protein